jgi:DedD protein
MKLVDLMMDERVKHRLTGVVVIIAIAIIFVPAMIKKSNQRLSENINVSVKLPPKPILPDVAVAQEKAVFNTVKVARVDVPVVNTNVASTQLAKNDVVAPSLNRVSSSSSLHVATKVIPLSTQSLPVSAATKSIALQPKLVKSEAYVVQLASFNQQHNAELLVTRLKSKGYQASYTKIASKQGDVYKVVVGQVAKRDDAQLLQKKLADNMQLQGFIVKTEVS